MRISEQAAVLGLKVQERLQFRVGIVLHVCDPKPTGLDRFVGNQPTSWRRCREKLRARENSCGDPQTIANHVMASGEVGTIQDLTVRAVVVDLLHENLIMGFAGLARIHRDDDGGSVQLPPVDRWAVCQRVILVDQKSLVCRRNRQKADLRVKCQNIIHQI